MLFAQHDERLEGNTPLRIAPNADEVAECRWVTQQELKEMLDVETKEKELRWSPWFLGIMDRGGWRWWENLEEALKPEVESEGEGNRFYSEHWNTDSEKRIEFFDPPEEHMADYNLPSHGRLTGVRTSSSKAIK